MMDLAEQLADRYKETPEAPFRVFLDEFYNCKRLVAPSSQSCHPPVETTMETNLV
jgi:hypothetical protein